MMYNESQIMDILRSVRHDLMNHVQLLKANLSLKRYDRVAQIVDELVENAQTEAKLSNLRIPKSSVLLLGYNWTPKPFKVKVDVLGEQTDWTIFDETIYSLLTDVFHIFERASDQMHNNVVHVSLNTNAKAPRISFCYKGEIARADIVEGNLAHLNQTYQLVEKYIHKEETVIAFELTDPLR